MRMRKTAKPLGVLGSMAKTSQQRATNAAIKGVHTALFGEPPKRNRKKK